MWATWNSGATSASAFLGKRASDGPNGMAYVQEAATGNIDTISEEHFTDNGTTFQRIIVTVKYDFDNMNIKTMSRLSIVGDLPTTSGAGNTISVYWTDNDYQTWSAARTLSFDNNFPTTAGTEITSADFPTPHCPFPVFMDGYLFVAKSGTQDIYNSNLDDPALWTAGDYISAEMYPDKIVALSKNNNYIYALGSNSIEYFYDAAVATGSPLGRHDSAVQQFGAVVVKVYSLIAHTGIPSIWKPLIIALRASAASVI